MSTDNKRLIYWKELKEEDFIEPTLDIKMIGTRMLVCDDERVDRIWETGSASEKGNPYVRLHLHLLMKDGSRWDSKGHQVNTETDPFESEKLFHEAEQYLKSLP